MKLIVLLLFVSTLTPAQQDTTGAEEIINEILETNEPEETDNLPYETLEELTNNPVNINNADVFELQKIPFIDKTAAEIIVNYRLANTRFFSVNELHMIKELSEELINKIKPFITVEVLKKEVKTKENLSSNIKLNIRTRFQSDLQERRGFKEKIYQGSAYKSYQRIKGRYYNNYYFGLLMEKDPGEKSYSDFTSFFISFNDLWYFEKVTAGDYLVEFGQGLALWSPYGFSKGSEAVMPVKKNGNNFREYSSTDENRFFRGAAAEFKLSDIDFTLFYSANVIDANIDSVSFEILSLPVDGYHRTINELNKKDKSSEKSYGIIINKKILSTAKLGFLYYHSAFSKSFLTNNIDSNSPLFDTYSFNYDFNFNIMNFFGEFALVNKSYALLNGVVIKPSKNFSYSLLFRYYPEDFRHVRGNGFGESGLTGNEIGFYSGIKWITQLGELNFYFDQFRFPNRTFYTLLPSSGYEFLFNLNSKPADKLETTFRLKYENKEFDVKTEEIKITGDRKKYQIRGEFKFKMGKSLELKNRIEYVLSSLKATETNDKGVLGFTEIKYKAADKFQAAGRFIFFSTDNYNAAVYEYETDLYGVMTNLPMYGEGVRWYLVLKYDLLPGLKISCKYSETIKSNTASLGSGYNTIEGTLDNKLSLQLDFHY